jgi:gluconolactonase
MKEKSRKMLRTNQTAQFVLAGVAIVVALTFAARKGGGTSGRVSAAEVPGVESSLLKVDRLDPAADRIVPLDAVLERVATGFTWIEGPVWVHDSLMFAEITSNSIRRWTPGTGVSIFLQPSGYQGKEPYGGPEPGSNGMTLDAQGRLTVAGHARRNVYRLESLDPKGPITVLADSYKGKALNSPNDVVYGPDGSLYFTDPPYGLRTQSNRDPDKEQTVNGVYRIPHALTHKAGAPPANDEVQLIISDIPRPNGIVFSPDGKYLYVDNTEPRKYWMRYTVQPDGTVTEPKLLYDASADRRRGVADGMRVDREGNIYSAGPGGIWIFSPDGKPLATLLIPEQTSNVAWGGSDRKTLYVTATSSIYRVRLEIDGH